MPMFRRVETVQWTGGGQAPGRPSDDGSVSIETNGGRVAARPGANQEPA